MNPTALILIATISSKDDRFLAAFPDSNGNGVADPIDSKPPSQ
ncbi:MAG: hypothetical protein ACKV22_17425 [Bryobacteraceae bacterium]